MQEQWRNVVGYEGVYHVSNLGRVKRVGPAPGARVGRILVQMLSNTGSWMVTLSHENIQHQCTVHRLVAFAFLGPPPTSDHEINHIDGDRTNNRVTNLEWVTRQENAVHAHQILGKGIGETHPLARLTQEDVGQIRRLYAAGHHSLTELAAAFGVDQVHISRIVRHEAWTHVSGPRTIPAIPHGEKHYSAKLSADDVTNIRSLYTTGQHSQYELSRLYGVSRSTIEDIIHRRTWKHVT